MLKKYDVLINMYDDRLLLRNFITVMRHILRRCELTVAPVELPNVVGSPSLEIVLSQ